MTTIKYKLVGGPFHAKKFFTTENLAPLVAITNGDEVKHYYVFSEMRGLNYMTYTYVNACQELHIDNGMVNVNAS